MMDKMQVVCEIENCVSKKQPMRYDQLLKHAINCPPKNIKCPLLCVANLKSIDEAIIHLEQC